MSAQYDERELVRQLYRRDRKINQMRELLMEIGGFSTHYVKPEHRDEWAKNLDRIDTVLEGAPK